jgi:N6-adenosine-specific RNA methylase IME4
MILVADPPWRFNDKLPGPGRGAEKHYNCMSLLEICQFPRVEPTIKQADILFMWRVASMQEEAMVAIDMWGFELPQREFVWVKLTKDESLVRMGMGHVVRNAHEVCLIAKRKGCKLKVRDRSVPSVFYAPREEHSRKPDVFYEMVERLYEGPYVELFARRRRSGWDCRGEEAP